MKVFRYRLQDLPERYHTFAVDKRDAILDICETWECAESDITDFEQVEPISSRRPECLKSS